MNRNDIKTYLTSLEPNIAQATYSQSIGGYPSISLIYPETSLVSPVDLYDTAIEVAGIVGFNDLQYVKSNMELIKVDAIKSTTITAESRTALGSNNTHIISDIVQGIDISKFFNSSFNDDNKQYRCVAIKNTATEIARDFSIYMAVKSINTGSVVRMAMELPHNDALAEHTVTGGTKITLIDSGLAGSYVDNYFITSYLRINAGLNVGQNRVISSYDGLTGTFVLDSALPFDMAIGDTYQVDASPCQRLVSGVNSPDFSIGNITSLSESSFSSKISIDFNSREHGPNLYPNDIIYIWFERKIIPGYASFQPNGVFIICNYFQV